MGGKYVKINNSHMLTSMTIIDNKERWNCPNLDKLHATKEKEKKNALSIENHWDYESTQYTHWKGNSKKSLKNTKQILAGSVYEIEAKQTKYKKFQTQALNNWSQLFRN